MLTIAKKHWPLIVTLGLLWGITAICAVLSVTQNQGRLVYSLDDAYIHMALAKNFSQHGVWGLTRYGFSSTSSSLIWPIFLSASYALFGVNEISPFVLNILFATLICVLVYFIFKKNKSPQYINLIILFSVVFFTPLIPLIFMGMEHVFQILVSLAFVYFSAQLLTSDKHNSGQFWLLFILTPCLTTARYEGLFLLFIVACLFLLKKRFRYAMTLTLAGIIPLVLYGAVSLSNGWHFLPNPVLLKGDMPNLSSPLRIFKFFFYSVLQRVWYPHILIPLLGALVVLNLRYRKHKDLWRESNIVLIVFIAVNYLHFLVSSTHWSGRYEAYIITLGIYAVSFAICEDISAIPQISKRNILHYLSLAVVILLSGFIQRGVYFVKHIPRSTSNIYQQQYQMGLFLKKFYTGKAVAVNDIGAANFLADIKCFDLLGLGNIEGLAQSLNIHEIEEKLAANQVGIGIANAHFFDDNKQLPPQWAKAGQWKILNNRVCGDDTITFYAFDPLEKDTLLKNYNLFVPQLPPSVILLPAE